jgi:hypothetical protein
VAASCPHIPRARSTCAPARASPPRCRTRRSTWTAPCASCCGSRPLPLGDSRPSLRRVRRRRGGARAVRADDHAARVRRPARCLADFVSAIALELPLKRVRRLIKEDAGVVNPTDFQISAEAGALATLACELFSAELGLRCVTHT